MPKRRQTKGRFEARAGTVIASLEMQIDDWIAEQVRYLGFEGQREGPDPDPFNPFRYVANEMPQILNGIRRRFETGDIGVFGVSITLDSAELLGIKGETYSKAFGGDARTSARAAGVIRRAQLKGRKAPAKSKRPTGVIATGGRRYNFNDIDLRYIVRLIELTLEKETFRIEMQKLAEALYKQYVLPAIEKNLPATLKRSGHGGSPPEGITPRGVTLSQLYKIFQQLIKRPPAVQRFKLGKGFGLSIVPFSINALKKLKIPGTTSRKNSLYMILEFGTGAKATYPRLYKSKGKTPWKLPPQVAAAFIGSPVTAASWVTMGSVRERLLNIGPRHVAARASLAYGKVTPELEKEAGETNVSKYESLVFGKFDHTSIEPSNILLSRRGVVKNVQIAFKKYVAELAKAMRQLLLDFMRAEASKLSRVDRREYVNFILDMLPEKFFTIPIPDSIFDAASYSQILDELQEE